MNCVLPISLAVFVSYLAILTACMPDPVIPDSPQSPPASPAPKVAADPISPTGTVQLPPKSGPVEPEPPLPTWNAEGVLHFDNVVKFEWTSSKSETVLEVYRPFLMFGDFPASSTMVIMVTEKEMKALTKAFPDKVRNADSKMPLRFCK